MPIHLKLYTHVYVYKILMPMRLSDRLKYYTFTCIHIYDLLNIPHSTVTFIFTVIKFLLQIITILHLADIFLFPYLCPYFYYARMYLYSINPV